MKGAGEWMNTVVFGLVPAPNGDGKSLENGNVDV